MRHHPLRRGFGDPLEFLETVGTAGIILNPDKFQFAEREVDFAGFQISETTIEPLPKFLDAIRDFPTPTSTQTFVAGLAW